MTGPGDLAGTVVARHDPTLSARVVRRVAMRYSAGADSATDRPAHVRAASGVVWVGTRLAVIQDDANFVALVDPATGLAEALALPRGPGGVRLFDDARGNKANKFDHEALTTVSDGDDALLVALGSGAMPRRESVVVIAGIDTPRAVTRVHAAHRFYATLRAPAFAGSELNVEGAIYLGGSLRLFGRGNGAMRGGSRPVNASCDVAWGALLAHLADNVGAPPPPPMRVVQYELGALGEARLTFTDATLGWPLGNGARPVFYSAAAEASPDAVRDGEVSGSAIGVIEERSGTLVARWAELREADGSALPIKAEGIVTARHAPGRLLVVVDADTHDQPSELVDVQLGGSWPGLGPAT